VQDRLRAITGPRVSNGRHLAYLLAAGTAQSPPLMVVDLGRWFAGKAARHAAIADGALTGGEHLFRHRYVRNTEHDWRILQVGTGALFTLGSSGGGAVPTNVTFTTLASLLSSPGSERLAHNPFWLRVEHHVIASGREQRYRAP
jgi:hypothetical protein